MDDKADQTHGQLLAWLMQPRVRRITGLVNLAIAALFASNTLFLYASGRPHSILDWVAPALCALLGLLNLLGYGQPPRQTSR
jgi:hypothetical protein